MSRRGHRTDYLGTKEFGYGEPRLWKEVLDFGMGRPYDGGMKHITDREVELTHREVVAKEFFEDCLDHGASIIQAASAVERFGRRTTPYDPAFLNYLRT